MGILTALALAFAAISRLIAMRARRLERQRRQLLEDVGLLQAALLPVIPGRLGSVATSVAYRPADGPAAGGDFYDLFALDDGRVAVILGDLSGHGRHALSHTALVRFTLRAYLESGLAPRTALRSAAAVLDRQLGESFATVIVAIYDPDTRRLVYASAGHQPPAVLSPAPLEALTVCSAAPIGLLPRTATRQTTLALPGAAVLCFYTDGLADGRTASGRVGSSGVEAVLAGLGPRASAEALLERVGEQTVQRADDMAACVLAVEGGALPARVAVEELELCGDDEPARRARCFLEGCGLGAAEIDTFLTTCADSLTRARDVILEVTFGSGGPEPALRQPDLPVLHLPPARGATRMEMAS